MNATILDPVTLTSDLIRIDSTTHTAGERECLDFVASIFQTAAGYKTCRVIDGDGRTGAVVVGPESVAHPSMLLLSGHIDTVPAEAGDWEQSPWSGAVDNEYVYGRGAADMKSGLAAQICAMLKAGPAAPVVLAVSRAEEDGCIGTPDVLTGLREWGVRLPEPAKRTGEKDTCPVVGAVIVAEPTNNRVVLGHKGLLWITVETQGEPTHGSMPAKGDSAIYQMCSLIDRARRELPLREHKVLGAETMSVGTIAGGTATNVVAATCTATVDIRLVEHDAEPLLEWWRSQPEVSKLTVDRHFSAVCTEENDEWVQTLPVPAGPGIMPYGTEAGPLDAALGFPPAVIWGPGSPNEMHIHNEKVSISAIREAESNYLEVIRAWGRKETAGA